MTPDGRRAPRRSTPTALGLPRRRRPRRWPAATRPQNAALDRGRAARASRARGATSCCSTPGRRSWSRGRRSTRSPTGIDRARADDRRRARDGAAGQARATERRAADAAEARRRGRRRAGATTRSRAGGRRATPAPRTRRAPNVVARDRRRGAARTSSRSSTTLGRDGARRRARRGARAPRRSSTRLAAPGPPPHRRGQAPLAVGRRDRRGVGRRRRARPRLRRRRRGRDLRPVRAALVRRLGRRPARRPRRGRRPGARQGVRRRPAPARPPPRRRRRPRAAARGAPPADARSRGSSRRPATWASSRWSRPTTRASSRRALATDARLDRRQQPRPADARRRPGAGRPRCATLIPDDRLAIAESGVRDAATVARWRATGLRRRARRRGADALARPGRRRRARSSPPAATRVDLAAAAPGPVREDLRRHRRRRGPRRGPRRRRRDRPQLRARHAARADRSTRASSSRRSPAPPRRRPARAADRRSSPPTCPPTSCAGSSTAVDPDAIQLSGDEPPSAARAASAGRPGRRCGSRPGDDPGRGRRARPRPTSTPARSGSCSTPPAGRTRAAPGMRVDAGLAAAVAPRGPDHPRRRPRRRRTSARRAARDPGRRRRRRLGHGGARASTASARARTRCGSRCSRSGPATPGATGPTSPFGPTPVHAGPARGRRRRPLGQGARLRRPLRARDADGRARAARGGLRRASATTRGSGPSSTTCSRATSAGRPRCTAPIASPPTCGPRRRRQARGAGPDAPPIPAIRLYLKREDLAHTGAHKINNALGQALLTRRLGKTRVIAETGAGQHGVATATACALLGLPCVVFMGEEDIRRQAPNVLRMHAPGRRGPLGHERHGDAQGRGQRGDARLGHERRDDALRPRARRWARTRTPRSCATSSGGSATRRRPSCSPSRAGCPDLALACVGGGSNAIGLLSRFIGEPSVRLAVAEAAGDGIETGRHAAAIAGGTPGILHGVAVADAPGPRRPGRRGALGVGRARLPGRRPAAGGARRGRPARGRRPRPTARRWRRCAR